MKVAKQILCQVNVIHLRGNLSCSLPSLTCQEEGYIERVEIFQITYKKTTSKW